MSDPNEYILQLRSPEEREAKFIEKIAELISEVHTLKASVATLMKDTDVPRYFDDDNHALRGGFFAGALMKAGLSVEVVTDDDGNYTTSMLITLPPIEEGLRPIVVGVRVTNA